MTRLISAIMLIMCSIGSGASAAFGASDAIAGKNGAASQFNENLLPSCPMGTLDPNTPQAVALWRDAVRAEYEGKLDSAVEIYKSIQRNFPKERCNDLSGEFKVSMMAEGGSVPIVVEKSPAQHPGCRFSL